MSDTQTVVDDESGTMDDLLNSLFPTASAEGSEPEAGAAEEEQSQDPGTDTANPDPDAEANGQETPAEGGTQAAPTGGDIDIEALQREAQTGRQLRNTIWQSLHNMKTQDETAQVQQRDKAVVDQLASLVNEVDPNVASQKAETWLKTIRAEQANIYLPQIDAAEAEHDRAAQGVVVLHETIKEMLTPEQYQIFEKKVDKRLQYTTMDALNQAIKDEREAEERISKATVTKDREIEALKLRLAALERAGSGVDRIPSAEDAMNQMRGLADLNEDDNATVDDLINAL